LFDRQERFTELPGDYDAVKAFILAEASAATQQGV
jgi:threonine synthase